MIYISWATRKRLAKKFSLTRSILPFFTWKHCSCKVKLLKLICKMLIFGHCSFARYMDLFYLYRVNRRIPLIAYYFVGGIALICVFIIQVAGKSWKIENAKSCSSSTIVYWKQIAAQCLADKRVSYLKRKVSPSVNCVYQQCILLPFVSNVKNAIFNVVPCGRLLKAWLVLTIS